MEGKGLVLDCWRGHPSSGESWMSKLPPCCSCSPLTSAWRLRSSELQRSLFSSYTALAWGQTPLNTGRSERAIISSDTVVGVCTLPACCSKQHMTQNTWAVLCLAHPSAIHACFLLPLCLTFSLDPGRSVWPLCEPEQTPRLCCPVLS